MNAVALDPALLSRAQACEREGRLAEAAQIYQQLLARHGELPPLMHALALVLHRGGRSQQAVELLERAATQAPGDATIRNNLGNVYRELGRQRLSLAAYEEAVRLAPDHANAHWNAARLLNAAGRVEEARARVREMLRVSPGDAEAWNLLGSLSRRVGDTKTMRAAVERAFEIAPGYMESLLQKGDLALMDGDFEAACDWYRRALDADPQHVIAYERLAAARRYRADDLPFIAEVEARLGSGELTPRARSSLHFALGKMLDDCGDYERAFGHFAEGNALLQAERPFDRDAFATRVERLLRVFDAVWLAGHGGAGHESALPVFVTGMMRSGTTLVEQVLSSHPAVVGAGELAIVPGLEQGLAQWLGASQPYPECMTAVDPSRLRMLGQEYLERLPACGPATRRVVDKRPFNFMALGLIAAMLPNAGLLYCQRSPIDVCLSNFFQNFTDVHTFTCDLADLAFVHRQHERVMAHWRDLLGERLLTVEYERLVEDVENGARRMIDHLGLPWDDACLRHADNRRTVQTASLWQVRQPVYKRSVERWRHYEPWIGPLLEALAT